MKKALFITVFSVLALTACNTEVVPVSNEVKVEEEIEANAEVETEISADGLAAKEELNGRIEALSEELKMEVEEVGYLTPNIYTEFRGNANLIAAALESPSLIEYNDNKHIKENLDLLLKEIETSNEAKILRASENLNSSKNLYLAHFQSELKLWMDIINLQGQHNTLDTFVTIYGDSDSTQEIQDQSLEYIQKIEKGELEKIEVLEERAQARKDSFSEQEFNLLNSLIQNLKTSILLQIEVLEEFSLYKVESDMTLTEKVNKADQSYLLAETDIQLLESELELDY
jgi:hypothetical protein